MGMTASPPATNVICETWAMQLAVIPVSRRESIPQIFAGAVPVDSVPALAGMTAISKGIRSQITLGDCRRDGKRSLGRGFAKG